VPTLRFVPKHLQTPIEAEVVPTPEAQVPPPLPRKSKEKVLCLLPPVSTLCAHTLIFAQNVPTLRFVPKHLQTPIEAEVVPPPRGRSNIGKSNGPRGSPMLRRVIYGAWRNAPKHTFPGRRKERCSWGSMRWSQHSCTCTSTPPFLWSDPLCTTCRSLRHSGHTILYTKSRKVRKAPKNGQKN